MSHDNQLRGTMLRFKPRPNRSLAAHRFQRPTVWAKRTCADQLSIDHAILIAQRVPSP
jgi:hypothetical protein